MRSLPPLKALRAFEAAARHLSFKMAADELGLTPTAISHQIRMLETVTGCTLFRRRPRPLALTSAGSALSPVVGSSFEAIANAFAAACDRGGALQKHDEFRSSDGNDAIHGTVNTSKHPASGAPRLSIVVLPFADIGGVHEQEYFAKGITESLTTDLSRISGAFVIGHTTAYAYKDSAIDIKQIGRTLSVRYALQGSLQRAGNRLRINVQLIDCDAAVHLWAERFDKTVSDLFEMQDEIVTRLASQLGAQLVEAEARRAERSPDPDSMDLYFRAMALINRGSTTDYLKPAAALLQRALLLDPHNVDALAAQGWVDMDLGAGFMADDRRGHLASAEASASKALTLAPGHAFSHLVLGSFYSAVNRNEEAISEFQRALALDRNLVYAHAHIGMAKTALGRAEEAESYYMEALRLSPHDVAAHHWMSSAATAKLHLGQDEEAVLWFRRAIEANRNFAFSHLSLAAALAHVGRVGEARAAAKIGLELEPTFRIARFRAGARSEDLIYLSGRERIYRGMRRAGISD